MFYLYITQFKKRNVLVSGKLIEILKSKIRDLDRLIVPLNDVKFMDLEFKIRIIHKL